MPGPTVSKTRQANNFHPSQNATNCNSQQCLT
ncbi:hypothetical protein CCUS01_06398 [Colletotrichum cuscutae]|uniref:Uncharacterized protein n=1 Tax=Colletotrichum cuscutae TaxID=1209917 RepID=A0AAI9V4B7_9PEZI|nr:hypothetical protein CCUS01_06398 [Colletotrichum cuscutae]